MVVDDVVINKSAALETALKRIGEEYQNNPINLQNTTKQESVILNLQRACESAIDLAMHVVAVKNLGVPQTSRDAFDLLYQGALVSEELAGRMKRMVGFRNIAIHQYEKLNLNVLESIIVNHLEDFRAFVVAIKSA